MNESEKLLKALGVSGKEVEIAGHTFTIHELSLEQVGFVIRELEKLSNAAVAVIELLNPATNEREQYFKTNWFRMAAEAQVVVYQVLAFSLALYSTDDSGNLVPNILPVKKFGINHLPRLLKAIGEVNESFFGECIRVLEQTSGNLAGVAGVLAGLKMSGSESSEPSGAAVGA